MVVLEPFGEELNHLLVGAGEVRIVGGGDEVGDGVPHRVVVAGPAEVEVAAEQSLEAWLASCLGNVGPPDMRSVLAAEFSAWRRAGRLVWGLSSTSSRVRNSVAVELSPGGQ